ncbi:MAG: P-II family nitrogen regulator [Dehalococcoidia bacterium]|nr:P-II family nitrogen regulator [Dehalococcoidia bacterium]
MNKIEAIIRPEKLDAVKDALAEAGFVGLNAVSVTGRGVQRGVIQQARGAPPVVVDMLHKVKIEVVVKEGDTEKVIDTITKAARTGNIGDGKIFVSTVADVIRIRTGERGTTAV